MSTEIPLTLTTCEYMETMSIQKQEIRDAVVRETVVQFCVQMHMVVLPVGLKD